MEPTPLAAGILASWAALTPSLVPRRWWMTGVSVATASAAASGVVQVTGAAVRMLGQDRRRGRGRLPHGIAALLRRAGATADAEAAEPLRTLRRAAVVAAAAGVAVSLRDSVRWQVDVARRTGVREASPVHHLAGYAVGLGGWAVLHGAGRLSRGLRRRLVASLARSLPIVPPALVASAAALLVIRFYGWMLAGVLARADQNAVIQSFAQLGVGAGPAERVRSGARESYEPVATMGLHGRAFVTGGPRGSRIQEVWGSLSPGARDTAARGRGTTEPIRVFAGRLGHPDPWDSAAAVVAELERTGAFSRSAILVAIGTGSGWVPPWSTSALRAVDLPAPMPPMMNSFFMLALPPRSCRPRARCRPRTERHTGPVPSSAAAFASRYARLVRFAVL